MTPALDPEATSRVPQTTTAWEHIPDVFGFVEDISNTLITREAHQFLLTNAAGNIPAGNSESGLGFYYRDTRHLSVYDFLVDGARPIVLLSSGGSGFDQEQVLGNHRFEQDGETVGRATIQLTRERVLNGGLAETLRANNFNRFPVTLTVAYHFNADFADIFEVRGHPRKRFGMHSAPVIEDRGITFRYLGADGVWRKTAVEFDRVPDRISEAGVEFDLALGPRAEQSFGLRISVEEGHREEAETGLRRLQREYASWRTSFAHIHTSNEVFNQVLERSIADLRMLWTPSSHDHSYIAAGTPWYSTLFGRDSIITALQVLPFRPDLARQCLALLARHQGQGFNPETGEQPGKILHEEREDELSAIGELPYHRYYGSVDATPLFLILAAEYVHWTGDIETLGSLLYAVDAALAWLRDSGDLDGDGFIEYPTDSGCGLRNHGWKDSIEAIVHADGRICDGPIALAEVQGYVYLAYQRLAPIFDHIGRTEAAAQLRQKAKQLRQRFEQRFWLEEEGYIAMALDGEKQPVKIMSSNAGQVLWSGILSNEQAAGVCDALFQGDMFSGWGIRTLSSSSSSYFPLGYHLGTVWPHDNGIIALGLKHYEMTAEVNEIATAMFDAAQQFPMGRLPELIGGHPRVAHHPPVPYPVACRPQAWTAGATLHLIQAVCGLKADALNQRLIVDSARLPFWLTDLTISGLQCAGQAVSVRFASRHGLTSASAESDGNLKIRVIA